MARAILIILCTIFAGYFSQPADAYAQKETRLTDITGYDLTITKPPARIISLIPSNTELLFAVGAGSAVVGVTNYCNYPPEVKKIDKIGDLMALSLEKIVALKPDLVLATGDNPDETIKSLRTLGIRVFVIDPQTVVAVIEALKTVGLLTGHESHALKVARDIENRLATLNRKFTRLTADIRPTVFVGTPQRTENYTPGPGTFTTDIIYRAGGRNVADDLKPGTWAVYSLEKIIEKNPEVILSTTGDMQGAEKSRLAIIATAKEMAGWKDILAIRTERVAILPDDWLLRPGPRMIQAIEHLAQILHPDLFGKD